jgi:hypothetical protein
MNKIINTLEHKKYQDRATKRLLTSSITIVLAIVFCASVASCAKGISVIESKKAIQLS